MSKVIARFELEFVSASMPPRPDQTVICCDGEDVFPGWYEGNDDISGEQMWFDATANCIQTKVISWAYLPAPSDCVTSADITVESMNPEDEDLS